MPEVSSAPSVAFASSIVKRSKWLRNWNVRQARVFEPSAGTPGILTWEGGATRGYVPLANGKVVVLRDRLIVTVGGREYHFRWSPGGASLEEWRHAITTAADGNRVSVP